MELSDVDPCEERTGVCLLRVERRALTGLYITVVTSLDVRQAAEEVKRYVEIEEAIAAVRQFLSDFEGTST